MEIFESKIQTIRFPLKKEADWKQELITKLSSLSKSPVNIDCRDWLLSCRDLQRLVLLLSRSGNEVNKIYSYIPETIVSANSLGYQAQLILFEKIDSNLVLQKDDLSLRQDSKLLFHEGTLRSGDHLKSTSDVLLLGDVNPGARISAEGNVMIWGRLRGIAHAGSEGNRLTKITALQLWPLQLRVADLVARGPAEKPEEGLAEEALIKKGQIVIEPASLKILRN